MLHPDLFRDIPVLQLRTPPPGPCHAHFSLAQFKAGECVSPSCPGGHDLTKTPLPDCLHALVSSLPPSLPAALSSSRNEQSAVRRLVPPGGRRRGCLVLASPRCSQRLLKERCWLTKKHTPKPSQNAWPFCLNFILYVSIIQRVLSIRLL